MSRIVTFLLLIGFLFGCHSEENQLWTVSTPAGELKTQVNPSGKTILPNGRIVKPHGQTVRVAPHPYGLTISPDGTVAVTANSGTRPFSISIIRQLGSTNPAIQQVPEGAENDEGLLEAVFMGLAITPDNKSVYVAGGISNKVFQFDLETGNKLDSIDCSVMDGTRDFTDGYLGDLTLSSDGKRLYVLDQIGFRLIVIDTESKAIVQHIPTGRYPFGLCLLEEQNTVYVANVGQFEYSLLGQLDEGDLKGTAAEFPTSGYNTKEMIEGYKNDSLIVPGLGDPNSPEGFSVWKIKLGAEPSVAQKIKTGFLVGDLIEGIPAVGGASPNSIVATDRYVFTSNGTNDCISVIDFERDTVVHTIYLKPDPRMGSFRGVIPFGLCLSPDQKRLYVAESGINAVAVINTENFEVLGHIPVGWFPSKLKVTPDGKQLIVANAKGYGSGPNGGRNYQIGPEGTYIGNLMKGSVTVMDIPTDEALEDLTRQVIENNFQFHPVTQDAIDAHATNPIPLYPAEKESPIKYIVFISKENRTYDEVFGQVKGGQGDPSIARFGVNQTVVNQAETDSVVGVTVMANHLRLANQYAIADNFYVDSDHSADGHRWLVNTYPNEWVETSVATAYGGKRRMKPNSKAPGNLALVGATGAIYPEDYNEAGSIWEHFERHEVDFFNFGFGMELAPSFADSTMKYTGVKFLINFPVPGPLYNRSSRQYATYNMAIPDQFRADQFIQEFKTKYIEGEQQMPQVLTILLPNDHGARERPAAGYPYFASYMMDNDLALGRIVEFLSNTPYWNNMAIFVTEDDSQNGVDHIDAHRSLLMVISPYTKKNYVGHQHYSFGSIFKTFWNILGTPYLNQYDAGATDLSDLFRNEPDFSPYVASPVDVRVFDPQKVLDPFDESFDWQAVIESPMLDNVDDFIEAHQQNEQ